MSLRAHTFRHTPERSWRYSDLDAYQRALAERIASGAPGELLLSEVAPVITLGNRRIAEDLRAPRDAFSARGIELYETDRGGRATYHGPGQWVVFCVEKLEKLTGDRRGVRAAVEGLMRIATSAARAYVPGAACVSGERAGVWSDESPRARKLVSVGVRVRDGVLLHGICVNAHATPESFFGIAPCGLDAEAGWLFEGMAPGEREGRFMELRDRLIALYTEEFRL